MALANRLFHAVTYRRAQPAGEQSDFTAEQASMRAFLDRFDRGLRFAGRTVLDLGCGSAVLCAEAARQGATHVSGVDLDLSLARTYLAGQPPEVTDRIELVPTAGDLQELGDRRFDLIVSKDSFEHYADPESFISRIRERLTPGGELVIGFSPLWKAPAGGHITYMTPLPWAHLIFPEHVIMAERRRFRPDEDARRWSEVKGGLNQMTLARFERIVGASGLEPVYFATNVGTSRAVKAMRAFSRVPPLREYFTQSVYTILRRPA